MSLSAASLKLKSKQNKCSPKGHQRGRRWEETSLKSPKRASEGERAGGEGSSSLLSTVETRHTLPLPRLMKGDSLTAPNSSLRGPAPKCCHLKDSIMKTQLATFKINFFISKRDFGVLSSGRFIGN